MRSNKSFLVASLVASSALCSLLGIAFGMAFALAACFGPPFTLRAPPTDAGKSGAGGQGGDSGAGGELTGAGGSGGDAATTLVVQDGAGKAVSGIKVVVNDATGAVVQVTEAGQDGHAKVTIPIGGSASVFSTVEAVLHIRALLDPPPGLTIPVIVARPAGAPEKTLYQGIVVAAPPATDRVYVWSTCDSAWSDMILDNEKCRDAPSIDFLAVAYDAGKSAIAWGTTLDLPTSTGGNAIFVPLDVSQTAFHTLDAAITGTLPAASYGGVMLGGDLSVEDMVTLPSPLAPLPLTVMLRVPAVPGMGYRVHEFAWSGSDGPGSVSRIERERHYAALPASSTFAVTSVAPLSVNPLNLGDSVHPELTWSVAGGERGDQGTLGLSWSTGVVMVTYEAVFAPDHTTSFRVPDIPAELSSYAPTTFGKSISVWYDDFENAHGYGDVLDGVEPADGLGRVRSGAYLMQP